MSTRHYILLFLLLEIFGLAAIVGEIGFWNSFLLWLLCGLVGMWIVHNQGMGMIAKAQQALQTGGVPVGNLFDGICLLVAGLLFLMPGFFGDILAVMLLFPQFRQWLRKRMPAMTQTHTDYRNNADGDVIDGSYVRVDEPIEKIELTPKNSEDFRDGER